MDRYQYLILMGLCVAITLPLEVLFRARVWQRPRRLLGALAPAMALFVAWDLWATASGTWGFNDDYTIGVDIPGGMAIEELVFFTVIPICGLLTLETVRRILRIWDTTSGSASERLAATARRTFADDGFRAVQRGLDPAATQGPTPPPAHAVPVSDAGGLRSSTGDGDATEVR